MQQRGRKSTVALAVVSEGEAVPDRLGAPESLSDAERAIWVELVNSKPVGWFGDEHIPMMVEYARQVNRSRVIDGFMRDFRPEDGGSGEGLVRYERLVGLGLKITATIKVLATAMRLTHQSVYSSKKAGMGPGNKGRAIWQREHD